MSASDSLKRRRFCWDQRAGKDRMKFPARTFRAELSSLTSYLLQTMRNHTFVRGARLDDENHRDSQVFCSGISTQTKRVIVCANNESVQVAVAALMIESSLQHF
eukprot:1089083-Rhodomonas_salina.1